ncbi:MAG: hypothetical protein LC685_02305, partial [Actinobacteria bacterium]|nr:hypothetical protein [Actinomycetota bacterium]
FHLRSYDSALKPEYDAPVVIESLIHAPDLCATMANLAAGLLPDGLLLVLDDMATGDLDVLRPADPVLVRENWGFPGTFPTDRDFRAAMVDAGQTVIHDEDLSPLMRIRGEELLERQERRYTLLKRTVGVAPIRTVVSAFLGGVALERLHGTGDVDYRLLVARNDAGDDGDDRGGASLRRLPRDLRAPRASRPRDRHPALDRSRRPRDDRRPSAHRGRAGRDQPDGRAADHPRRGR